MARVDFGGGVLATRHEDNIAGVESNVTQTDLHAFVGASVLGVLASGRLTQSVYSEDPEPAGAPVPFVARTAVPGLLRMLNVYPKTSIHLRAEATMFPMVRPFATFTHATFKAFKGISISDVDAFGIGAKVGLEMLFVHAQFEHLSSGGANLDQFSFGGGLRF